MDVDVFEVRTLVLHGRANTPQIWADFSVHLIAYEISVPIINKSNCACKAEDSKEERRTILPVLEEVGTSYSYRQSVSRRVYSDSLYAHTRPTCRVRARTVVVLDGTASTRTQA